VNTAAINILSQAGISGTEAEATLRHVLANLAAPSERSREILRGLGLEPEDVDPSNHRIAAIVRRLADAGLDEATALTLFTSRGAPAILALIERVAQLERLQNPRA
jgi:hypothetical protein